MNTFVVLAIVLIALVVVAAFFGKRHARRFQRERRIRVDRFKLKRRHAEIELEVFGSREIVRAIQRLREGASRQRSSRPGGRPDVYLQEIVPKFNLLAYYRIGAPLAQGDHALPLSRRSSSASRCASSTRRCAEGRGGGLHDQPPLERRLRPRRAHALQVHLAVVRDRRMGAGLAAQSRLQMVRRLLRAPPLSRAALPRRACRSSSRRSRSTA